MNYLPSLLLLLFLSGYDILPQSLLPFFIQQLRYLEISMWCFGMKSFAKKCSFGDWVSVK